MCYRKLFTIYGGLYPRSDADRLYIPREDGERGLIATEDCMELEVGGLEVYVHGKEERLTSQLGEIKQMA